MKINWLERLETAQTRHERLTATEPAPIYPKPLRVPDACYECTEYKCYTCPHSCKIGLIIGKQYTADHVFH